MTFNNLSCVLVVKGACVLQDGSVTEFQQNLSALLTHIEERGKGNAFDCFGKGHLKH